MNKTLVSICIPTYNGSEFIRECIDSAIIQTYTNIEILFIDDQSTDNTREIISEYALKDKRIKLYTNSKNLGLVGNWNRCMELANGEWIKFLFQDDRLDPQCVERMLNAVMENENSLVVCQRNFIFEKIDDKKKLYFENKIQTLDKLLKNRSGFVSSEEISNLAIDNMALNFIGEPSFILFKRKHIQEFGVFNPNLDQLCDLEYCLRIAVKYGIVYIPEKLVDFRVHGNSVSSINLETKIFILKYIDPIILTNDFIYDSRYVYLREKLSLKNKFKLKLFFKVRTAEAYHAAKISPENLAKFNAVSAAYSEIEKYKTGSPLIKLILTIIQLFRRNG
ncbi:MAG: glycosyltransferase family 2 protein [Bacteroidia bacterium]|nr:glycosyltransferase family 2 protein [Bacteroidia bacterium]